MDKLDKIIRAHAKLQLAEFIAPTVGQSLLMHLLGKTPEEIQQAVQDRCGESNKLADEAVADLKAAMSNS